MKQIIPFKKELPFKTKVSDITSISLERELEVLEEGLISGTFHITGDYKMNEGSINRENFSFDLPFDITLDPRYDVTSVKSDIEDFYYDVINESILKVNIDLFVEAEYLPVSETKEEEVELVREDSEEDNELPEIELDEEVEVFEEENEPELEEVAIESLEELTERDNNIPLGEDLFSNLDSTETYTTYYVYIVKEEDTIDKILVKYGVTKEDLENYNELSDIKPGDKVIIPKKGE